MHCAAVPDIAAAIAAAIMSDMNFGGSLMEAVPVREQLREVALGRA